MRATESGTDATVVASRQLTGNFYTSPVVELHHGIVLKKP
jgi:hypothetical protein